MKVVALRELLDVPLARLRHRAGAAFCVVALAGTLLPTAVADEVTEAQLQQARSAEQTTTASIGELEASLAQLATDTQAAELQAQLANQQYLRSQDDLATAQDAAVKAADAADQAAAATEVARGALADVVLAAYQDGADPLQFLAPYLGAGSFFEVAEAKAHLDRLAENTDAELQKVESLQAVADTMRTLADAKQGAKQAALDESSSAKASADTAASTARSAEQQAQDRRATLIAQLARQRNTTVELETQRQDQIDVARRQAQEEAARQALEAGGAQGSAARTAPQAWQDTSSQTQQPDGAGESWGGLPEAPAAPQSQPEEPSWSEPEPEEPSYEEPAPAPAPGSGLGERAVQIALGYQGVPYVWGGASDSGVDCSGLMMVVWAKLGINLPHFAAYQYNRGTKVPVSQVQPGDMIFFSYGGEADIHHVAMYVGGGQMIEAPKPGLSVRVISMRYSELMPYAVRL